MSDRRVSACLWCGNRLDGGAEHLEGRVRCAACGAATTEPLPTADELSEAYGSWYRPESGRFLGAGDAALRRSRAWLARRLDRIAPPGQVLDVGAGDGTLLNALRARGRQASGLERSPDESSAPDAGVSQIGGEWAAVVFWHSLEHLPDPAGALRHAARLTTPGGVVIIAAPNSDSLQARAFGDRWFALDLPRHLVHLPAPALLGRLESLGFRIERVSYARGGQVIFGWLHGLVGSLPGHPDLYDAIRRPEASRRSPTAASRAATLAAGAVALPGAMAAAAAEVALRRGGSVYVEARRA